MPNDALMRRLSRRHLVSFGFSILMATRASGRTYTPQFDSSLHSFISLFNQWITKRNALTFDVKLWNRCRHVARYLFNIDTKVIDE